MQGFFAYSNEKIASSKVSIKGIQVLNSGLGKKTASFVGQMSQLFTDIFKKINANHG